MQCKDIPNLPILAFLEQCTSGALPDGRGPATLGTRGNGRLYYNSVQHGMPAGTSNKLARAKMDSLVRSGLVDGCAGGHYDRFAATAKGRALLAAHHNPAQ